ncbi:MAG: hypothetical protein WCO84_01605 [bacterium]
MSNYKKLSSELEEEYIFRICSEKEQIGSWQAVADILNAELNYEYSESKFRKQFQAYEKMFNAVKHTHLDGEYLDKLENKKDELYKQQVKTSAILREKRALLKEEANMEMVLDAIRESDSATIKLPKKEVKMFGKNEAVLLISDAHIGNVCDNFYNKYNEEIMRERFGNLQAKTLKFCKINNVKKLHIICLGDMIEGNIHVSGRISADLGMVKQVKVAAKVLAELINNLANEITETYYHSVLDNHSRMNKKYQDHIEEESFASFIDWWLRERLANSNVKFMHNKFDENLGCFQLDNGKNAFFAHGHLEQKNSVLQDFTFSTGLIAHYAFLGHWHSGAMKEFQGSKLYINGSIKGVDQYCMGKRLFAKPSQTLLVFDGEDEIDIRINL